MGAGLPQPRTVPEVTENLSSCHLPQRELRLAALSPVENHTRNDFPGDHKSYVPRLTPPRKSLETLNLIAQEDAGMGGSFKSILKP